MNERSATNSDGVLQYCPYPDHIKPCWCGGNAVTRCEGSVRGRRCKNKVKGFEDRCHHHQGDHR